MIVTEVTISREWVAKILGLPEDAEVVGFSEGDARELQIRVCSLREPIDIALESVDDIKAIGDSYRGIGTPRSYKGTTWCPEIIQPNITGFGDSDDDEDD